jgi:hypothetical protein
VNADIGRRIMLAWREWGGGNGKGEVGSRCLSTERTLNSRQHICAFPFKPISHVGGITIRAHITRKCPIEKVQ